MPRLLPAAGPATSSTKTVSRLAALTRFNLSSRQLSATFVGAGPLRAESERNAEAELRFPRVRRAENAAEVRRPEDSVGHVCLARVVESKGICYREFCSGVINISRLNANIYDGGEREGIEPSVGL